MATHSSTLAWRIPRREEPGRLQSMGSQRVGHDWAASLHFTVCVCMNENTWFSPDLRWDLRDQVRISQEEDGGGHKRASARWNTLHVVHVLFAVCEDCHLLIQNEGWLNLTQILKYLCAGCQACYVDRLLKRKRLLEEPRIWGLIWMHLLPPLSSCLGWAVPDVAVSKWRSCSEGIEM